MVAMALHLTRAIRKKRKNMKQTQGRSENDMFCSFWHFKQLWRNLQLGHYIKHQTVLYVTNVPSMLTDARRGGWDCTDARPFSSKKKLKGAFSFLRHCWNQEMSKPQSELENKWSSTVYRLYQTVFQNLKGFLPDGVFMKDLASQMRVKMSTAAAVAGSVWEP